MSTLKICAYCDGFNALYRCSECESIRYCCKTCQQMDWKYHKKECSEWGDEIYPIPYASSAELAEIAEEYHTYGATFPTELVDVNATILRYNGYSSYDVWRYGKLIK